MLTRRRVFLLLSFVLVLTDATLVGISYRNAEQALDHSLREQGEQLRRGYQVAYAATLSNMLQMATFIANDTQVQQHFLAGKRALEAEGGGAGGERSAVARQALLDLVGPAWERMAAEFDARQLHFHLGPGSLSFLRVHRPEKFGDRMDDVRFIIADTNADRQPRSGFETGRVYSGLRGVVPVWAETESGREHVGSVEVGTSFKEMFQVVDAQLGVGVAALLRPDHVRENMWPSFVRSRFAQLDNDCECLVEAASRDGLMPLLTHFARKDPAGRFEAHQTELVSTSQGHFAVTSWPLYDYHALSRDTGERVGAVVIWRDAGPQVTEFRQSMYANLTIAVVGFVLLELALYWAVRLVTGHLERQVAQRTAELAQANERLNAMALTDPLTGLGNRRRFMDQLEEEVARAGRHGRGLVLAMVDVDHFKRVNDRHGHPVGDRVLVAVAGALAAVCRSYDLLGRYGGEEMAVILPETTLTSAVAIAERMREAVTHARVEAPGGETVSVSVSIGLAEFKAGVGSEGLLAAADRALYAAKAAGRNRVVA